MFQPILAPNGRYVTNLGPFCSDGDNNDEFIYKSITSSRYLDFCTSNPDHKNNMFRMDQKTLKRVRHFNTHLYGPTDQMMTDRGYGPANNRDKRIAAPDNMNAPKIARNRIGAKRLKRAKKKSATDAPKTAAVAAKSSSGKQCTPHLRPYTQQHITPKQPRSPTPKPNPNLSHQIRQNPTMADQVFLQVKISAKIPSPNPNLTPRPHPKVKPRPNPILKRSNYQYLNVSILER